MARDPASSPSVEEALRAAAARFALLADGLELQAVGDLERLLSALPVELLNWSDAATRKRGRHP